MRKTHNWNCIRDTADGFSAATTKHEKKKCWEEADVADFVADGDDDFITNQQPDINNHIWAKKTSNSVTPALYPYAKRFTQESSFEYLLNKS